MPSKDPGLENIIDLGDDKQFLKDIEIHESQDQAHLEFSELYREPWREEEQLKQLYKTHMNQIKDQRSRHSRSSNKDLHLYLYLPFISSVRKILSRPASNQACYHLYLCTTSMQVRIYNKYLTLINITLRTDNIYNTVHSLIFLELGRAY